MYAHLYWHSINNALQDVWEKHMQLYNKLISKYNKTHFKISAHINKALYIHMVYINTYLAF